MNDHRLEIILAAKDISDRAFKQFQNRISSVTSHIFSMQGAIATLTGAGGLGLLVKTSISTADAIGKTADKLGISTKALQEYRFAASQSGVASNTLDMALQRFTRRAAEAYNGTGELKGILQQYGIAVADTSGKMRRIEDIFDDLADVIGKTENASEQLRIGFKAFDSEGAALVNMLKNGSAGLKKFKEEAEDLGIVINETLIRDAEKASDQLDVLGKVVSTNVTSAMLHLAPEISNVSEKMADWVKANKELIDQKTDSYVSGIITAAEKISEFLSNAKKGWDILPGIVKTAGIIGAVVYGKTGVAVALTALSKVGDAINDLDRTIAAVKAPKTLDDFRYRAELLEQQINKMKSSFGLDGIYKENIRLLQEELKRTNEKIVELATGSDGLTISAHGTSSAVEDATISCHNLADAAEEAKQPLYDIDEALRALDADAINFSEIDLSEIVSDFQSAGFLAVDSFKTTSSEGFSSAVDDIIDKGAFGLKFSKSMQDGVDDSTEGFRTMVDDTFPDLLDKMYKEEADRHEKFLDNVQDITANVFEKIFDGNISGWSDFFDEIFSYYKRLLAQMAAQAIAQPIIMPIVSGISGISGFTQGGGYSNGTALSSAGNLVGLTGLGGTISTALSTPIFPSSAVSAPFSLAAGSTYRAPTWGGALGAAGWGSLGYSTIGDWVGLPQGKYSSLGAGVGGAAGYAAGAAGWLGGATAGGEVGSAYPVVGTIIAAIIGGVVGALTGSEKKHKLGPFNDFSFSYGTSGEALPWGGVGEWHDEQGGWADKIGYSVESVFTDTVDAYYTGINDMISGFPESIKKQINDALSSTDITIDFGGKTFWADKFQETATIFGTEIMDQMTEQTQPIVEGVISAAIAQDIGSFDWSKIAKNSNLMQNVTGSGLFANASAGDFSRAQGVSFENYVAGGDEVISTMTQMIDLWESFRKNVEEMFTPMTSFESSIKDLHDYFDNAYNSAEALGFSESALAEIRDTGSEKLANLESTYADARAGIFDDLEKYFLDISGQATDLDKALWAVDDKFEGIRDTLLDSGMIEGSKEWIRLMDLWSDSIDAATASINDQTAANEANASANEANAAMQRQLAFYQQSANIRTAYVGLSDQLAYNKFSLSGGLDSDWYMNKIKEIQNQSLVQMDDLERVSELTGSWMNAAITEATNAAQASTQAAQSWTEVIDRTDEVMSSIDSAVRGLTYGNLNVALPNAKFASASSDYENLFHTALKGSAGDVNTFLSFASTYLETAQEKYKSSPAYESIFSSVIDDMSRLSGRAQSGGFNESIQHVESAVNNMTSAVHVDLSGINAILESIVSWNEDQIEALEATETATEIGLGDVDLTLSGIDQTLLQQLQETKKQNEILIALLNNSGGDTVITIDAAGFKDAIAAGADKVIVDRGQRGIADGVPLYS